MEARAFLRSFGLRPAASLDDAYWRSVAMASRGRPFPEGPLSPEMGDLQFATDDLAKRTLSADFDRFADHLEAFDKYSCWPSSPKQICDLGGGCGLVGMYLALRYPDAKVVVYDWSEKPIAIGRKWARGKHIHNIEFAQRGYEEIPGEASGHFDLVLAYHAVDMMAKPSRPVHRLSEMTAEEASDPDGAIRPLVRAADSLTADNGLVVVCNPWSWLGLLQFFLAVRETSLAVDWSCTVLNASCHEGRTTLEQQYLFLRRGFPWITDDAWEDVRAVSACGCYSGGLYEVPSGAVDSHVELFSSGRLFYSWETSGRVGEDYRVRLWAQAGLLLLEWTSTSGYSRGFIHSVAAVSELLALADKARAEVEEQAQGGESRGSVHPEIRNLLRRYGDGGDARERDELAA